MKYQPQILIVLLLFVAFTQLSGATFLINNINTTVILNQNSSASVTEIMKISISNNSAAQYSADRLAFNLTLSQWQNLIGPQLVEHIVNPHGSLYNFHFLPGPLNSTNNGKVAFIVLTYDVSNVTVVQQIGPRNFSYTFNKNVFNFQNSASGASLGYNTTLNMILPYGSKIVTVYPPPDYPPLGAAQNYKNVTKLSWSSDDPLSRFALVFLLQQSLQGEVLGFFGQLYGDLGVLVYVIIAAVVAVFIIYTYLKSTSKK